MSRRVPTAVVAASANPADAELVQQLFINDNFRVYTGSDVVGVELGGALKNVMAIAAGIIDGMKLGDNPKAALMTRGISEMGRLGELLGGKAQTFSGLSGIGDLIVTCTSGHSRNRTSARSSAAANACRKSSVPWAWSSPKASQPPEAPIPSPAGPAPKPRSSTKSTPFCTKTAMFRTRSAT